MESLLKSHTKKGVPFNDFSRIHNPLVSDLTNKFQDVLKSGSFVLGPDVETFESNLAAAEGCEFAVATNSGTSALELALRAIGVKRGDEVITTSFTFVATVFAILQIGAIPVLADVDLNSGLLSIDSARQLITSKTKALVLVTIHGRVENLTEYKNLCAENDLKFVIDAAQSHLGKIYEDGQVSFCDVAATSFYPGKNLGALGEGGAILTDSDEIMTQVKLMRDWGASEKYQHEIWGGNFRLDSIQAAFLNIKLKYLEDWTRQRLAVAEQYSQQLAPNIQMSKLSNGGSHVYHIFGIKISQRDKFCSFLKSKNIAFSFHYPTPVHKQTHYKDKVIVKSALGNCELLSKTTVSLPIFPGMENWEIEEVIQVVNIAVSLC